MADTTIKLSGTYDSIEAYELLEEMRGVASDYLPLTGGEISGDLIVDGQLSANLIGNVTGTASGNLPLSGGTMTGSIILDTPVFASGSANDIFLQINGGTEQTNGAWLRLNGKDNTGNFQFQANDGTNSKALVGRPTGNLTWDGNIVPTKAVNIQTGTANVTVGANTNATVDITFSTPFTANPLVLCTPQTGYAGFFATVTTTSTTGATFRVHNTSSTSRTVNVGWMAISL